MTIKLPFWATLLTLCGVSVLCALGTWQLYRLEWKNDIIQKLDAAYASQGTPLSFKTMSDNDYAYGTITGIFQFDKSIALGYRVEDGIPGYSLITPLKTNQGTLLINMGFTPDSAPIKDSPLNAHNAQTITFTGLARSPSWNSFTPKNDPANDKWYRYDIPQIAAAKDLKAPIPFILYADKASIDLANPPHNTRWTPRNNHAQYAFFWFALAGTLIIIYILRFVRKSA